jgi:hypothetical protein
MADTDTLGQSLSTPFGSAIEAAYGNGPLTTGGASGTAYPTAGITDPLWDFAEIDGARWNQYFPYQLLILKVANQVDDGSENPGATLRPGYSRANAWQAYTLPIPPQEMAVSMPIAINSTVTMNGYVEEHNAAPTRMINFAGTFGVLPVRQAADTIPSRGTLSGIFANTITGLNQVNNVIHNFGGPPTTTNLVSLGNTGAVDTQLRSTGYWHARALERFLETYLAAKKQPENSDLRLALCVWKNQAVYLVTPLEFTTRKSANSPSEVLYNLQFRAYKRISMEDTFSSSAALFSAIRGGTDVFHTVQNIIASARQTIHALKQVGQGVFADVHKVLGILRETAFFCKDATGAALTFVDLPQNIVSDAKQSWLELTSSVNPSTNSDLQRLQQKLDSSGASAASSKVVKTLSDAATQSGKAQVGSATGAAFNAHPINKILDNVEDHYDFFSQVPVGAVHLPPAIVKSLATERARIRQFTRLDFEQKRDYLQKVASDAADAIGDGDVTYNTIYNRTNTITTKTPTDDHYELLYALNETIMGLNRLAVSGDFYRKINPTEYVAGLAQKSGIVFQTPHAKFAIPFPYGFSLEQLALQYLGTPDRWNEIATLNGLRSPFVDEVGFDMALLTNGRGNQVAIADVTNLYVGQSVWLASNNTSRAQRHIRSIDKIDSAYYLLTLDGDADLDRFTTSAFASLHAFLPDTVNSQMMLYIPAEGEPADADLNGKSIPGINIFDNLIQVGGVDLLLTPSGDLAVTPDGDIRLAIGLANIVQRVRVAITTPRGTFLHHPDFGLGLRVGGSLADISAASLLRISNNLLKDDPAFTGVYGASVSITGPVARISLSVGVAGGSQLIPITVQLQQ